jgi:hypothetical protein
VVYLDKTVSIELNLEGDALETSLGACAEIVLKVNRVLIGEVGRCWTAIGELG